MTTHTPETETPGASPFALRLRQEREKAGISLNEMARRCCTHWSDVEAWEDGRAVPTRLEFKRLIGSLRRMRFYPPDFTRAAAPPHPVTIAEVAAALDPDPPSVVEPLPMPEATPAPRSFGEALRRERELEDVDQETVGGILGVTGQAVSSWETERVSPVKDHYTKLVQLFPRLAHAPEPDWRDIPPPDGGRGVPRSVEEFEAEMANAGAALAQVLNETLGSPLPVVVEVPVAHEEPAPATESFDAVSMQALRGVRALQRQVDAGSITFFVRMQFDPRSTNFEVGVEGNTWVGKGKTPSGAMRAAMDKLRSPLLARRDELRRQLEEAEALVKATER